MNSSPLKWPSLRQCIALVVLLLLAEFAYRTIRFETASKAVKQREWAVAATAKTSSDQYYRITPYGENSFQPSRWNKKRSETLNVLFIGNSYTFCNDMPLLLREMSSREARPLEVEVVAFSNFQLQMHWQMGIAQEKIKNGRWDYVVLQEFSTGPLTDKEGFFKYARLLDEQIKLSGSKTLFYMTWARQRAPEMQAVLADAYTSIARELNAEVAPAGLAWQEALKQNPDLPLYIYDGSHPTSAGSYLTACVFYAKLYGHSAKGLPASIGIKNDPYPEHVYEVTSKEAELLQRAADTIVLKN